MASPLPSGKQSVSLASNGPRVSRIRRDPPPPMPDEKVIAENEDRDARMLVIGVVVFALALLVITLAITDYIGWSPAQYTVTIRAN